MNYAEQLKRLRELEIRLFDEESEMLHAIGQRDWTAGSNLRHVARIRAEREVVRHAIRTYEVLSESVWDRRDIETDRSGSSR